MSETNENSGPQELEEQHIVMQDEVQLLGYGESDSFGGWVKFRLLDPSQLGAFRNHAKTTPTKLGQRYGIVLVEIGDDEQLVKQDRDVSKQYSKRCAMILGHADLDVYIRHLVLEENLQGWPTAFTNGWTRLGGDIDIYIDKFEEVLLDYLQVGRKRDIFLDDDAKHRLNQFEIAFNKYRQKHGLIADEQ